MNNSNLNIFDDTGDCVSYETLKAYIDNKLDVEEKHRVELHLIDCPFCAEATEGFAIAQNQLINTDVVYEEICSSIDIKTHKKKPSRIFYIYAAAASITLIVGISILFNYTKKETQTILSENTVKYTTSDIPNQNADEISTSDTQLIPQVEKNVNKSALTEQDKSEALSGENKPITNQIVFEKNTADFEANYRFSSSDNEVDDVTKFDKDQTVVTGGLMDNKEKLKEESSNFINNDKTYNTKKADELAKTESVSGNTLSSTSKTTLNSKSKTNKDAATKESKSPYKNAEKSGYYAETAGKVTADTLTLNSSFYLNLAYENFNKQDYQASLKTLDEALKYYPNDYNIIYVSGLSNFYLKKYNQAISFFDQIIDASAKSFKENAMWYKALSLLEIGNITAAKTLLTEIISINGSCKVQAEQKLKTLK